MSSSPSDQTLTAFLPLVMMKICCDQGDSASPGARTHVQNIETKKKSWQYFPACVIIIFFVKTDHCIPHLQKLDFIVISFYMKFIENVKTNQY